MPNPIVHFELPVNDPVAAQDFYTKLFDWEIKKVPMGDMDYYTVMIGPDDSGVLNGGMSERKDSKQGPVNYIQVDDIEAKMKEIEAAGGTITMPKTPVKGMGYFCHFDDTQNNTLGLWQDDKSA